VAVVVEERDLDVVGERDTHHHHDAMVLESVTRVVVVIGSIGVDHDGGV
jgi:hypothetical protein